MRLQPIAVAVLGLMLAGSLLAGCNSGASATAKTQPMELRLNLGDEPPNIDPQRATDQLSFDVLRQVEEGLVRVRDLGHIEKGSGLAKDWSISPDGLTYSFTLKDGIQWSDGQPIKAQDFAYAWKRALDPRTASQYNYQLFYIKGGEAAASVQLPKNYKTDDAVRAATDKQIAAALDKVAVKAVDDKTLTVTLAHATPYFLGLTEFSTYLPARQDYVEKLGDKYGADADKLLYTGPFRITGWTHENELVLEKNPTYWDAAAVKLGKVTFHLNVKDPNTAINMFEAGDLDTVGIPGDFIEQYKNKGLQSMSGASTYYLEFNTHDAIFKNANIRKAFSLAIDRKLFADNIMRNGSQPATGLVPPSIPGLVNPAQTFRQGNGDLVPVGPQPDQAKRLLAQGLHDLGLQQLPQVSFLVGDSATAKKYAQGLQEFWNKNLGVQVKLDSLAMKQSMQKEIAGQFQMSFGGWSADYADPMTFMDLFVTGGGNQYAGYANANYDKLVLGAKQTADQNLRQQDLTQAEKLLLNDAPIAPLYVPTSNWVEKPSLKGMLRYPVGYDFDLKWASIGA